MFVPHTLFGSGGTFTSLAAMVMASKGQNGLPVRGYQVTRAEVRHLLDRLRKTPLKDRAGVPGLSPERADIIVAGLAIVVRIMDRFEINTVQVHNRGVRDGLLLTMIDESLGTSPAEKPHDRDAAIERLAASCGCEMPHSRHVAKLAGSIFSQLAAAYELNPADRGFLEAAAKLQDVGYLINYDQHHKHSYHLILHSNLDGFQPHELELVANVARYHRGADPKRKHENFRQLSDCAISCAPAKWQPSCAWRADWIVAIHSKCATCGSSWTVTDSSACESLPGSSPRSISGVPASRQLFEKVFDAPLTIEWDDAAPAAASNGASTDAGSRDSKPAAGPISG